MPAAAEADSEALGRAFGNDVVGGVGGGVGGAERGKNLMGLKMLVVLVFEPSWDFLGANIEIEGLEGGITSVITAKMDGEC